MSPVIISVTSNFPLVSVPVLSVNKTLILPAVSMPTNFLTKTLFFNIFFMLLDKTKVIIIGKPSGTATTIIVTLNVKAYIKWSNINLKLVKVFIIRLGSKLLSIMITENKYDIVTNAAPK